MRLGWKASVLAAVTAVAFASGAAAQTPSPHKAGATLKHASAAPRHGYGHGNARVGFAPGTAGGRRGHGTHYADLVGDPHSGLGFYALPPQIRAGAARYRFAHQYRGPYGYGNPVQQAVIDDAARYNYWLPPTSAVNGYRYGVYDPIEGVGTPFFAGYYSRGDRDDDDDDDQPFGRPIGW